MEKKNSTKTLQLLSLIAFSAMALACTSSKDAVKYMDDVNDLYQYGRSLRSEIQTDSVKNIPNTFDMAEETLHTFQQSEVASLQ